MREDFQRNTMDGYFKIIVTLLCGIKLYCVDGNCLQWEKRDDVVNKIPADGKFLTAENIVHCANQCSKDVMCVSFFFTSSTINNCLLKYDVITDDNESALVDVTYSSYFVLKGFKRWQNGTSYKSSICSEVTQFRTVQLSDGTSFTIGIFKEKLTQDQAKQSCIGNASFLIQVTTKEKLDVLKELVKCPAYDNGDYYIDGSNAQAVNQTSLDGWVTDHGEPVPMTAEFWKGQPYSHHGKHCLIFARSKNSFEDTKCSNKYPYICERH